MDKNERRIPHPGIVANERYLAYPSLFVNFSADEDRELAGIEEYSAARFSEPVIGEREDGFVMVWTSNYVDPRRMDMYAGYLGERHNFDELSVAFGVSENPYDPNLNKPILIWQARWNLKREKPIV